MQPFGQLDQVVLRWHLVSFAILGFLSTGYGAASKVLSKYIVHCDTPASHLGIPRAPRKMKLEIQSETGDEDQPEVEPEPENNTELEGLFSFEHAFVFQREVCPNVNLEVKIKWMVIFVFYKDFQPWQKP